jgi:hypothetical protein
MLRCLEDREAANTPLRHRLAAHAFGMSTARAMR